MSDLTDLIVGDVYNREDWGAPVDPGGRRRDRDDVTTLTVHHTTGATLGVSNTVNWVANIYNYHVNTLNWADIGYAYLADRYGNVFVGRGRFRELAHARGYNRTHLGVAYLGTGIDGHVTDDAKRSLHGLRQWLRADGGMTSMHTTNGHRDIGSTACPGAYLYRWAVELDMPLPEQVRTGTFSDVPEDHPHYESIEKLAELGIVQGYPDGTFRPEQPMTRAQVAALFARNL